ncbi:exocyst complex component EXO84B-like [Cornus florida]|uniref:exocyst complex component EXO84B-like n=1 Tax=Cornus florida TaxID=4283 RepID=UPI0028A2C0BE|nr:exocyst complex component EXO84B-like [Cornus florida]
MADNPSSTSRFRFRDHQESDSSEGHTSSNSSSLSSDADDDIELESMTGKGIKHLCSELLELKSVSDEDFHKNIFSNYSAFVRIFEEVESMENELMQLKHHISTQKRLVEDLKYGIYLKVLPKETVESITEEPGCDGQPSLSILEAHANDAAEILDVLLSERRFDEALEILKMEARTFQSMQLEENIPSNVLMSYKSAVSERRAMIADQLTVVAENPRVSAPELQKALVGLHRLGDSNLATQLLLKYYHSRIASGIYDFQYSKTILHGVYIREVAKFVFSMISQAARSFTVLYGETSPYASELIQWACEETEVFAACFSRYVKSISETSGGLLTAVEAVQFATSYCSLLESQRIVLKPCLVKLIRPCMEDVLQIHIDHFKKVIGIFTSTDNWVVGRYLVSGTLTDECSSMVIGQQPEFCVLTNSGRKFVTLLQAITEDVSPLVALKMEGPILRGLMNIFTEYIVILERALTSETNFIEKGCPRISLAESPAQQISVVANLSTLVQLFSSIITNFFRGINHFSFEVDNFKIFIQEASDRVREHFCKQFISRIISHEGVYRLKSETCVSGQSDSNMFRDAMPSVAFQELFLELRNLEKLAEDSVVELDWLMDLLEELMETIFVWISNNKEIWTITEEDLTAQHSGIFKQFVLDIQFLVEIASRGGYCSNNIMNASLDLVSCMETAFVSAGLDPKRTIEDDGWAINAATEALQKLEEMAETNLPPNESSEHFQEEMSEHPSMLASDSFKDDDAMSYSEKSVESLEDSVVVDVSEIASNADSDIPKTELEAVDLHRDGGFDDEDTIISVATSVQLEDTTENAVYGGEGKLPTQLPDMQLSVGNGGEASGEWVSNEGKTSSQQDDSSQMVYKLEESIQTELPATVSTREDIDKLRDTDENNVGKAAAPTLEDCDKN